MAIWNASNAERNCLTLIEYGIGYQAGYRNGIEQTSSNAVFLLRLS